MSCLIITRRGIIGSYYYRTKTEEEVKSLYGALSLLEKDGLQIVSVSDIEDYKEYEPAIEIKLLAELFILSGNEAINDSF